MKAVSTDQIRDLDRRTIESGVPGEHLMERAGFGVARIAARILERPPQRGSRTVLLLAGKGNNGGDAFVAARHLAAAGCEPTLVLLADPAELRGDAATHFKRMIGVNVMDLPLRPEPLVNSLQQLAGDGRVQLIIDGLLGTGLGGQVREPMRSVIEWINHQHRPVIAIDIPSGLDSDTGEVHGVAVRAAHTITMGLPKRGLLQPAAADYVGSVDVVDIGFPAALVAEYQTDAELITAADLAPLFPPRQRTSHKGNYGHLLIIAGAEGYTGAPVLCAHAAARSGAGLVTLAVPEHIYPVVAAQCPPEVMPRRLEKLMGLDGFSALAIGPGLGQAPETQQQIFHWLGASKVPLVADADAVNAVATHLKVMDDVKAPVVFTPHPGEMARLMDSTAAEIQADRWGAARAFSHQHGVVLVLKGAGTIVTDNTAPLWINLTGNPGMARGGMGDALTGIIGAFLAQGLQPLDAARAGVYVHGAAGDRARDRQGETAMLATDLISVLGEVFEGLDGVAA